MPNEQLLLTVGVTFVANSFDLYAEMRKLSKIAFSYDWGENCTSLFTGYSRERPNLLFRIL